MTDVSLTVSTSESTSVASLTVTWVKNGGTPLVKVHSASIFPSFTYTFSYLNDSGGSLVGGDIVSATAAEVDSTGLSSVAVVSTPVSVTVPNVAPLPPVSVTLALH